MELLSIYNPVSKKVQKLQNGGKKDINKAKKQKIKTNNKIKTQKTEKVCDAKASVWGLNLKRLSNKNWE